MHTEKHLTPRAGTAVTAVPAPASNVALPIVSEVTGSVLTQITGALGVRRDVVALDGRIEHAWSQLPRLIRRIPPHLRDEQIVRACVAVATGLFDAAINFSWKLVAPFKDEEGAKEAEHHLNEKVRRMAGDES